MKLVDSSIIAQAEALFFSELGSSLDHAIIEKLFVNHKNMRISGLAQFQDLNVVVHNNQIAFKFDYTALAYFSIYMDRSGAFLKMEAKGDQVQDKLGVSDASDSLLNAGTIQDRETQLAEAIAGAIEKETVARLIEKNSHAKLNGRIDFMGAQFVVHQDQPVYNLIYQGEVALSFLVDKRGSFQDFAEIPEITNNDRGETTESSKTAYTKLEDIVIDEERGLIIDETPADDTEVVLVDGKEIMGFEELLENDLDDHNRNSGSN